MAKVYNYSITSEAAVHECTIKKLFWRNVEIPQKKTYAPASF